MILHSDDGTQSINFDIDEKYNKILVNCSGGADSAILLYMVVDYLMKNNRTDATVSVSTCANDFKHRWNARKAADVINWTIANTGFANFDMHYTYYRDKQDTAYFHEVEYRLFREGRTNLIISGITNNPVVEASVLDINGTAVDLVATGLPNRNVGEDAKALNIREDLEWAWYTPFHKVDKRFVASMYNQYNVMPLFDLTRSCEVIPIGDYNPEFEKTPCGECWWCLERKWAFGRW
jgi:hypothetical protein